MIRLHVHQAGLHRVWDLDAFKEAEHPRGQPENAGQFARTEAGATAGHHFHARQAGRSEKMAKWHHEEAARSYASAAEHYRGGREDEGHREHERAGKWGRAALKGQPAVEAPTRGVNGAPVVQQAPAGTVAARKGLRVGQRVRYSYTSLGGDFGSGSGEIYGFVRTGPETATSHNSDVLIRDDRQQRWQFVQAVNVYRQRSGDEFNEAEHPRGGKGSRKGGEFVRKGEGGGGGAAAKTSSSPKVEPTLRSEPRKPSGPVGPAGPAPAVSIERVKQRAWTGAPNEAAKRLTKQEAGKLGEDIALAYLHRLGLSDAKPLNEERANYPVDLVGDHEVYEIKTGQVSTTAAAAQWRATIGQPSKSEAEWLRTAKPEQKAEHNRLKNAAIMQRKQQVVDEYSQRLGKPVAGKTLTLIVDPDSGVADIFMFDGFHKRIGYNGEQAKSAYVGSYRYGPAGGQSGAGRRKGGDQGVAGRLRGVAAQGARRAFLWIHRGDWSAEARDIAEMCGCGCRRY